LRFHQVAGKQEAAAVDIGGIGRVSSAQILRRYKQARRHSRKRLHAEQRPAMHPFQGALPNMQCHEPPDAASFTQACSIHQTISKTDGFCAFMGCLRYLFLETNH
jgi:hypothetical protein